MARPLPPDESKKIARLLLMVHTEMRRQRGLPPSPWRFRDHPYMPHLAEMDDRSSLSDDAVLGSHRPGIGRVIAAFRKTVWTVLRPVFDRQTAVNAGVIQALREAAVERDRTAARHEDIGRRLSELENRWTSPLFTSAALRALSARVAELEHAARSRQPAE